LLYRKRSFRLLLLLVLHLDPERPDPNGIPQRECMSGLKRGRVEI
jgi:hypothetical protein